jgi:ribosomal protein S18 acetylase RimI-like enzyme
VDLPDGLTARRPTLDDVPAILAMMHAAEVASTGQPQSSSHDVREALAAPDNDPARDSWLVVDGDDEPVGWAYLDGPGGPDGEFVEVYAHPERGAGTLAPLLARQLDRVAERAAAAGLTGTTVRAGAVPSERPWIEALRGAGFVFVKRHARMRRSVVGFTADPPPPGVEIRPVRADDDADLRRFHHIQECAFADAPDHRPTCYEQWRAALAAVPSVPWDEWFVATVDGTPAGVLESSDQAVEHGEGWVKRLAVLRAYRRRGVGAALLGRAFAAYAAKGRRYAGLGVDLANPTEAVRLYRSVGMTGVFEADIYERTVTAVG